MSDITATDLFTVLALAEDRGVQSGWTELGNRHPAVPTDPEPRGSRPGYRGTDLSRFLSGMADLGSIPVPVIPPGPATQRRRRSNTSTFGRLSLNDDGDGIHGPVGNTEPLPLDPPWAGSGPSPAGRCPVSPAQNTTSHCSNRADSTPPTVPTGADPGQHPPCRRRRPRVTSDGTSPDPPPLAPACPPSPASPATGQDLRPCPVFSQAPRTTTGPEPAPCGPLGGTH
jgi:hypothetical protein